MIIRRDRLWPIRGSVLVVFALACGFAPGPRADAHALLWRSVPEQGAVLQRAPDAVTLTFTEPPEPTFSAIHVLDRSGRPVEPGAALAVPGQPFALRVPLNDLPDGVYTVTWRTVSRIDGHVAGGTFEFGIGAVAAASSAEDTSNLLLSRTRGGIYRGQGPNLSLDGAWSVVVVVERQNETAEVPLRLTIAAPPAQVRTIQAPEKAPVCTVALSGDRTLTISLEPGGPGLNALHATFTNAAGRELEIARAPEITLGRKSEAPRAIAVLQEGPGHFYADVELERGDWRLSITATTRAGETLRARLSIYL